MTYGPGVALSSPELVHPSALLYGQVSVGEGSSLWPHVVVRAERQDVRVGRFTNLQDFVMVHIGWDRGVAIGDYCSITHHVTLHGCSIGDRCLIGIGATIMDGCEVGAGSIVAGHAFLKEGTVIPPNSIVVGTPAKVVKTLDSSVPNIVNALLYHRNAAAYAGGNHRAWEGVDLDALQDEALRVLGV